MPSNAPVRPELRVFRLLPLLAAGLPAPALAEEPRAADDPFYVEHAAPVAAPALPEPAVTPREARGYQHWLGGIYLGRGLRFNNPYRLRRVLGNSAEGLSLTATYLDIHVGRTFSSPDGFEHGATLNLSIATDGIPQQVVTPSYLLVRRFGSRVVSYGRAGFPIVIQPDAALGLEAGLGAGYLLTANLGLGAELDGSIFYGAATIDRGVTVIPLLSLAVGVFFDWEHLP